MLLRGLFHLFEEGHDHCETRIGFLKSYASSKQADWMVDTPLLSIITSLEIELLLFGLPPSQW